MKYIIDIDMPDDFEPLTGGCEGQCPFGYHDTVCGYVCDHWSMGECIMSEARRVKENDI